MNAQPVLRRSNWTCTNSFSIYNPFPNCRQNACTILANRSIYFGVLIRNLGKRFHKRNTAVILFGICLRFSLLWRGEQVKYGRGWLAGVFRRCIRLRFPSITDSRPCVTLPILLTRFIILYVHLKSALPTWSIVSHLLFPLLKFPYPNQSLII